jgi:hypothetical protein
MLLILLSVSQIVLLKVLQTKTNHSMTWRSSHWHFCSLVINRESAKLDLIILDKTLHASLSLSVNHSSSKKSPRRLIPLYLQCLTSGFSVLVKMCGAVDRPNGKTVKIKYLRALLSGNFQANPKNVWYSGWISMWWYPI